MLQIILKFVYVTYTQHKVIAQWLLDGASAESATILVQC